MAEIDDSRQTAEINSTSEASQPIVVQHPKSHDISINASDLKLQLIHFKRAIKNGISKEWVIAAFSLWIPIFTSDFRAFLMVSGEMIKGAYILFAFIMTILLITPLLHSLGRLCLLLPFIRNQFEQWALKNEIDPEKKADLILNHCIKNASKVKGG